MKSSQGHLLKEKIQQHGYKITAVAQHLGISRRAMYKIFAKDHGINIDIVARIGNFIKYDFSHDFPSMSNYIKAIACHHLFKELTKAHIAYIALLEDYCAVFRFIIKTLNVGSLNDFFQDALPIQLD